MSTRAICVDLFTLAAWSRNYEGHVDRNVADLWSETMIALKSERLKTIFIPHVKSVPFCETVEVASCGEPVNRNVISKEMISTHYYALNYC